MTACLIGGGVSTLQLTFMTGLTWTAVLLDLMLIRFAVGIWLFIAWRVPFQDRR